MKVFTIVSGLVLIQINAIACNSGDRDIESKNKKAILSDLSWNTPNIIIILADDLGCGDMSLYNGWIHTPRIDQMASEGVRFTDFHSNSSVCSPTRAALLTGRYQQRVGIIDVIASHLGTPGLPVTELTIPRIMKQQGYATAIFGKWHLGSEPKLGTAMRDGHWKIQTKVEVIELYDLSRDIKETTNVADQYPERIEKMRAAIKEWKAEVTIKSEAADQ